MNEKLQEELTKIITNINDGTDSVVEFMNEQLPDVVHQLLLWHGLYSFVMFVIGIVLSFTLKAQITLALSKFPKKPKGKEKSWAWYTYEYSSPELSFPGFFAVIFIFTAFIFELMFIISSINLTWLQIYIAPKVWLLEYAANLTK